MVTKRPFKIILKGDQGVGKTSIAAQFTEGIFDINQGFDVQPDYSKEVVLDNESRKVELLDVPDDYQMGEYFTKCGHGFLMVYSISDFETFESLKALRKDIEEIKQSEKIPMVLVGNKRDIATTERAVEQDEAIKLVANWPYSRFTEISAKNYEEVEEAFLLLIREIIEQENAQATSKKRKRKLKCVIL